MKIRQDRYIAADPDIVPDGDRFRDPDMFAQAAEMFTENSPLCIKAERIKSVKLLTPDNGLLFQRIHFFIIIAVFQSGFQFLQFNSACLQKSSRSPRERKVILSTVTPVTYNSSKMYGRWVPE